jgi:hypothetical protein
MCVKLWEEEEAVEEVELAKKESRARWVKMPRCVSGKLAIGSAGAATGPAVVRNEQQFG